MKQSEYRRIVREAQDKRLELSKKQEREIMREYGKTHKKYKDRLNKIAKSDIFSKDFTRNDFIEYKRLKREAKILERDMDMLGRKVEDIITSILPEVCDLGLIAEDDFYNYIMTIDDTGVISKKIKSNLGKRRTALRREVISEIISGGLYKDGSTLSSRIYDFTKNNNNNIQRIIRSGITEGKSSLELARELEYFVNPSRAKVWNYGKVNPRVNQKVEYNALRLARTSVSHAYQMSMKRVCDNSLLVEGIRWNSSGTHSNTCELCKARNGNVYKPLDLPLDHPNGVCYFTPVLENYQSTANKLRDWVNGGGYPEFDKHFETSF